jgi:hypothetical protein
MAPTKKRGRRRIDLTGHHSLLKHNNQINDGVGGGGCIEEEMQMGRTRGGWCLLVGRPSNDKKIRETGEPLALDGHHLAIPHSNQIIAGVSGVEGV